MKFSGRLNSIWWSGYSLEESIKKMGKIDGMDYAEFLYPEHFEEFSVDEIGGILKDANLKLHAISLKYRDDFIAGEFTNVNRSVSEKAVKLCKEAIDACKKLGGNLLILWLGYDGFDYSFQTDYVRAWEILVNTFREICEYSDIEISIEYKPYGERIYSLIDSFGATMMMLNDVKAKNLGVTLDFCHMLMKKENPAYAAALLLEKGLLKSIHLNDGMGSTDDGQIVGSVNVWKTLEVFYYLRKYKFDGVIYFDTFPIREEATAEIEANIAMCKKMDRLLDKIGMDEIERVISTNDGIEVNKMYQKLLE